MGRLFWKFFFVFWLAQLSTAAGVGGLIWLKDKDRESQWRSANDQTPLLLKSAASTLQHGGPEAFKELMQQQGNPQHAAIFAVDENGQELLRRLPHDFQWRNLPPPIRAEIEQTSIQNISAADGHTYRVFVWPRPQFEGAPPGPSPFPPPPREGMPPHLILPLISGLIASLIFSTVLAWYFSKPIRHLRSAFHEAAKGNLQVRIGSSMGNRRDELAELGHHFDQMAEKIGHLMQAQRRLLHDVSHELRSPLARLQAIVGLLRQEPERVKDASFLKRIEKESVRIDLLVNELLTLARLEAEIAPQNKEILDLNELLQSIIDDAIIEAQSREIAIYFHAQGPLLINGTAELLHRALENILRNAIKYSSNGKAIQIESYTNKDKHQAELKICDQGTGVASEEVQKIFEPFYRGHHNGNQNNGYGLGLAIARSVIQSHGGIISAHNLNTGGLCVEIILPLPHPQENIDF